MRAYRALSLAFAIAFAATGLLFLFAPDRPVAFFNALLPSLGLPPAPAPGMSFYLILAVGYMYVVTVIAFFMFRHPENRTLPLLLVHAKLASSMLSLAFFLLHARHVIYLANFAVDGVIALVVLFMNARMRHL